MSSLTFVNHTGELRHPDGDWEELNEREVTQGKAKAEQYEKDRKREELRNSH